MERYLLKIIEYLVDLLENKFQIFGFRFGLDPIIGLIPGIGDFIGFGVGVLIVWLANRMGVSKEKQKKMWRNILMDLVIGFIPVIGDIGDFYFKSNRMNLEILKSHQSKLEGNVEEGEIIG